MSLCEFHPLYQKHFRKIYAPSNTSLQEFQSEFPSNKRTSFITSKTTPNLQSEVEWGISRRNIKQLKDNLKSIPPKKPSIDQSFKLCSEQKKKKKVEHKKNKENNTPKKKTSLRKLSLLEKSILPQNKYMEYLSMPNLKKFEESSSKKRKQNCCSDTCSPRLVQLAIPNKRRVYANWKEYHNQLPTEVILRYEQILHSENVLQPKQARCYYQHLDKQKKKQLKSAKLRNLKKQQELRRKQNKWMEDQTNQTIDVIVDFIKNEPAFLLNYRQLLLSDGILNQTEKNNVLNKPKRNSKDTYQKILIDISDKLALWMDTLLRFIDTQNVESDEDVPFLELSSCDECLCHDDNDDDGGSDEESDGDYEECYGECDEKCDEECDEKCESDFRDGINTLTESYIPPPNTSVGGFIDELDEDLLKKLIKILRNCPDEFLDNKIDKDSPVSYKDIIEVLTELQNELGEEEDGSKFMEKLLYAWALRNEPDEVDEKMHRKIKETAVLLEEYFHFAQKEAEEKADRVKKEGETAEVEKADDGTQKGLDEETIPTISEEIEATEGRTDEEFSEVDSPKVEEISKVASAQRGHGRDTNLDFAQIQSALGVAEDDVWHPEYGAVWQQRPPSAGAVDEWEEGEGEEEGVEEGAEGVPGVSVLYEKETAEEEIGKEEGEGVIKGHKPSAVFDHTPNTVCCLSLKIWAVWLLEITHNAHSWTKWVHELIKQVRDYASIVRGDVILPNGRKRVLRKKEWQEFVKSTEEKIIAWRHYSIHVKDLSLSIIENFKGKNIVCCPKCLNDHLIKNVVTAHHTLRALTEAMNCAAYWRRSFDNMVQLTEDLTKTFEQEKSDSESSESGSEASLADEPQPCICRRPLQRLPEREEEEEEESDESVYELEEIETGTQQRDDDISGMGGSNICKRKM